VQDGSFRQDLYYRINVIELNLPPLRARAGDIPQLTAHLLTKLANANAIPAPELSAAALQALMKYYFPGNIRELENILERALALHEENVIQVCDLNLPQDMDLVPEDNFDADTMSLESYLAGIERRTLDKALGEKRWDMAAVAKHLGLSNRSLRYRLKKLGLE
jgi:two-component system response regulator PilR (NtrC family)